MKKYAMLVAALLMSAEVTAQADVLKVSGNMFKDLGNSTIDENTRLEWRDFNLDPDRPLCSVIKDAGGAIPSGCRNFDSLDLIAPTDGWRVATRGQVAQLLSDWFGIAATSQYNWQVDSSLTTQFLNVFAGGVNTLMPNLMPDTWQTSGTPNPEQGMGFWVHAWGTVEPYIYNGDINDTPMPVALVRDERQVPEPNSLALLALALPALAFARRRKQSQAE